MADQEYFKFYKTSATTWATPHQHRGYTAVITYLAGTGYTLVVTGAAPPADATYPTLRNAKNAFRKFMHTIPVS